MIHYGVRGPEFINYVSSVLKIGGLKDEYIELITDDDAMEIFNMAFTSAEVNPENNYEGFEFIGDVTMNKIVGWWLSRKLPQLMNAQDVNKLARIKANNVSKRAFSNFARQLHTERYITSTEEQWETKLNKLLEDTLEAFIGAIEYLIDSKIRVGAGYAIVYQVIVPILDKLNISLEFQDLYDPVTRLKELFDTFSKTLGTVEYSKPVQLEGDAKQFVVTIYYVVNGKKTKVSQASSSSSKGARNEAANKAIAYLEQQGFVRLRDNVNYVEKLPPGYDINVKDKGSYILAIVTSDGKKAVGVGYTEEDAKNRAAYNMIKQL